MLDIEKIKKHNNMKEFQYLCERNAIQILLWGCGISEPLLLMRCGVFLKDCEFISTGIFSTLFLRPILDKQVINILGNKEEGEDWSVIDAHLAEGNPVFLDVDVYELSYKKTTYYHQIHGAHTIIVDKKIGDSYSVLDWYHPDYFYGIVSGNELKAARLSKNDKNKISVFSGFPINAQYRLINLAALPKSIDIENCVIQTLLLSLKLLTDNNGGLAFLNQLCNIYPSWLEVGGDFRYIKAAESLFFLDLELKMFLIYLDKLCSINLFPDSELSKVINNVLQIKKVEEIQKNKLLFAYRKRCVIPEMAWKNLIDNLSKSVFSYSECLYMFLKGLREL